VVGVYESLSESAIVVQEPVLDVVQRLHDLTRLWTPLEPLNAYELVVTWLPTPRLEVPFTLSTDCELTTSVATVHDLAETADTLPARSVWRTPTKTVPSLKFDTALLVEQATHELVFTRHSNFAFASPVKDTRPLR
jgi:hypothetical protein